MMKRFLLLAAALVAGAATTPRIARNAMQAVELGLDRRLQQYSAEDPLDLLGPARGVYVDKFGVVLSAEVNLVITSVSPFSPALKPEQLDKLRLKKLARLADVRRMMRETLVSAATSLKELPVEEKVVVGMTFFYRPFENRQDLPQQIVMQAPKRVLADYEAGRIKQPALEAAIQEQVY